MRKILRRPLRPGVAAPDPALPADEEIGDDETGPDMSADPPPEPAAPGTDRPQPTVADWAAADLVLPRAKRLVSLRIDAEVLEYFQRGGKGYQTRMNAVLRAFMEARQRRS